MNRNHVLRCGCYADAVPRPGLMRWLRWPNPWGGTAMWHHAEAADIEARGWVIVDGTKATVRRAEPGCPHILEMWFGGLWQKSHPGPTADPSYGR